MQEETQPTETNSLERTRPSRAQRRRAQRRKRAIPTSLEGRSALLQDLVQRAYPSYEFFVYAIFSGAILGLGYLLDSQSILLFGILMAPLITPVVGMSLGIVSGSGNYFIKSLLAFSVGSLLIFGAGALAGLAARLWMPLTFTQAFLQARLWWTNLVVLALGAMLLAASFVRSEKKPFLPSVMVAYGIFLPLNAAAFGLASQTEGIFVEGMLVFSAHLAWTLFFGALTLFFLGFRPYKFLGWFFSLLLIALLLFGLANVMLSGTNQTLTNETLPTSTSVAVVVSDGSSESGADSVPTQTSTPKPSSTPKPDPTATATLTPSPGVTLDPTATATQTLTPEPTPLYARIFSSVGGGAYIRREPNGPVIITLANDELVEALSDPIDYEGTDWVQIRVVRNDQVYEGWIMQELLQTATPAPTW